MRSTRRSSTVQTVLYFFLCAVFLCSLVSPCLVAQNDQQLSIEILNLEQTNTGDNVMYEGNTYTIGIGINGGLSIVQDVTITVPWATYLTTNDTPVLEFTAPNYSDHSNFTMTASKQGYESANMTIAVLRGALHVTTPSTSVKEDSRLTVTVTDQRGTPIADAQVLEKGIPVATTDSTGQVVVSTPDVSQDQEVVLAAVKDGYVTGTRTVVVSNTHSQLFTVDMSQILPVIVAVFIVIFAVGLVRWRQMHRPGRDAEDSDDSWSPGMRVRSRSPSEEFSTPTRGPSKIEEIRIPMSERKKDTTVLSNEKEHLHHPTEKHLQYDEWFQGTDYAKFKLDEMTGKIDKQKDGKWFVGETDIESKVDKTLKKKTAPKKTSKRDE